ncbi:hypothetical protein S7711_02021 [Stachybotrys chartarum IBT 7711]|uniref:Uncharacterized protein n=1 Tax=Stachybotrys chartarum (strain CBS 109288 / IBT 7711) TaxID=1280523 RepID=A0A084AW04_STACB|nr:hypothetical protein S7711_02021 [Stachybotrys chartarum IBT 7711]
MPLEQTITVINNSGKIISTGKQLLSIFKEAKASYEDKKSQIKSERGLQRAQTFDPSQIVPRRDNYDDYYDYEDDRRYRRSYDDNYSEASSRRSYRSRDSRESHSRRHHENGARSRPALTEVNLKTLSEVSSVTPSRPPPPAAYRSPYAETIPLDMAMSKMDLAHADMRHIGPSDWRRRSVEMPLGPPGPHIGERRPVKEIDMDLAYGNIPPDLATRHDLDPGFKGQGDGNKVQDLVKKVEGLLDEAHCLQFSATSIISHLQQNPDTAADVALTLADLSSAISSVSPAVLGLLKGSSPAVFALLASPQFLIGTSIMVGVTVVMFGGWKIVKKVKEGQAAREALAYEGVPMDRPAPLRTQSEVSAGIDEALVLEEELSTIETWRRGILPYGENERADLELITPEAERANRERKDDFDVKSHKSAKTTRTSKTVKTQKSSKTKKEDGAERKSSSRAAPSEAGSTRSKKTSQRREMKAIDDGKSKKGDGDLEVVVKSRPHRHGDNMLKALFKSKKEKERRTEMVLA